MNEQELREQIAEEIEKIDLTNSSLNALGMKMLVLDIVRGKKK